MKLPPHYKFADWQLAQTALTHRSFGAPHNERLEWLGDAIVEFEISRLLYRQFSDIAEGGLSQLRTQLVSGEALAALARRLQLGEYARLGSAGMHGGRNNDKLLAGLMEAYIAAVYLDGGDVGALLADLLADDISALAAQIQQEGICSLQSAKTQLQELLQRRGQPPPAYELLQQHGKADKPTFVVECRVDANLCGRGRGRSRARAEQQAAADCLEQLSAAAEK